VITSPERTSFPALSGGLVYLDSAATSLAPRAVAEAVGAVYLGGAGAAHRSTSSLAAAATSTVEGARAKIARLLDTHADCIVFTRGTTEGLTMLARGLCEPLAPGDEVVVSEACHHASYVGFRLAAARAGVTVRVAAADTNGEITAEAVRAALSSRTRVVSLPHVSNVTGALLDAPAIAELARARGATFVLDGAQAFPHVPVSPGALGCHAYVFGAHKAYGPRGVGVLWGEPGFLDRLPPLHGGGHMVLDARTSPPRLACAPALHEAGTLNLEGIAGLAAALDVLVAARDRGAIAREHELLAHLLEALERRSFVRVLGRPRRRVALATFEVAGCHPHDVATLLDADGIAVRAGHMCAHPLFSALGSRGALRASLAIYTDSSDVDALASSLDRARDLLSGAA